MDRVTPVTSFGRSGVSDWVIQRISAVFIAIYTLFLLGFLLLNGDIQYGQWVALFANPLFKLFSLATLLLTLAHAWIGIWGVLTDYVTVRLLGPKATWLRFLLQFAVLLVLVAVALIGVNVLWSV